MQLFSEFADFRRLLRDTLEKICADLSTQDRLRATEAVLKMSDLSELEFYRAVHGRCSNAVALNLAAAK